MSNLNVSEKEVQLDLGIVHQDQFIKSAYIRKMKAGDRVDITSADSRKKPFQKLTNLLTRCTIRFGDDIKATPHVLENLNFGDRDKLLLELRKFSMGDIINVNFNCGKCQEEIQSEIDLNYIKCRSIDDPNVVYIEDGQPHLIFRRDEDGLEVHMRIPTGKDQSAVSQLGRKNLLEADYELYRRCLTKWGEKDGPFKISFIYNLDIGDIDWLEAQFKKYSPGPQWNIFIDCDLCGYSNPASLGDTDFLFQSTQSV